MPESKNNFLKGRMNKDLDERLLQDGEYRDARNASITSSDTGNSGSIESIDGNSYISNFGLSLVRGIEIIGVHSDASTGRIFVFLTNYTDSSPDLVSNFAPTTSDHYIYCYDTRENEYYNLVQGNFLNFSKTHPILNVNIVEDLLFWTDDRNQPRKINIQTALENSNDVIPDADQYYYKEEHISVAKYYPYNPIRLYEFNNGGLNTYNGDLFGSITQAYDTASLGTSTTYTFTESGGSYNYTTSANGTEAEVEMTTNSNGNIESLDVTVSGSGFQVGDTITFPDPTGGTSENLIVTLKEGDLEVLGTMKDSVSKNLPFFGSGDIASGATDTEFTVSNPTEDFTLLTGCVVYVINSSDVETTSISEGVTLVSATLNGSDYDIELSDSVEIASNSTIYIGGNPDYNATTEERKSDLKDKFVRFAYRFKYDDNEYSLVSPFTQPVFIPKQDGYFLGDDNDISADETRAYKSSNVAFFENKVTKVNLVIDLPEDVATVQDLFDFYKVKEIDIIIKESNEPSLKIVETIEFDEISTSSDTELIYEYSSNEAFKVLPESDLIRVSDKIPVRAKTQEVVGNRVMYGNYLPIYPYEDLDFSVTSGEKKNQNDCNDAFSKKEYPLHSLKQNRTYQVGVVLCDKFGRQSDVIVTNNSTIKHSYRDLDLNLINDSGDDIYMGDSLSITFNDIIPEKSSILGYKGIYNADTNPMGWYSYKVVVKQKEQSYFNCYVPSILNGYPVNADNEDRVSDLAHITLVGDNINKIPRELDNVNDNDSTYSSEIKIYPRVSSIEYNSSEHRTVQLGDTNEIDDVIAIGTRDNLGLDKTVDGEQSSGGHDESPFYGIPNVESSGSNPFIARISTSSALGTVGGHDSDPDYIAYNKLYLDVVETNPTKSNLDIFYETSSVGLISELNQGVLSSSGFEGVPNQVDNFSWFLSESTEDDTTITNEFTIQDANGDSILNANTTAEIISARNKNGVNWLPYFEINKTVGNKFKINWVGNENKPLFFGVNSDENDTVDLSIRFTNLVGVETVSSVLTFENNSLKNELPLLGNDEDDYGTFNQAVNSTVNQQQLTIVDMGWRRVETMTFKNGSLYNPSPQVSISITSLQYYNTNESAWKEYYGDPFMNSSLPNNDWRNFVRLVRFDGDDLNLYYSPLLHSVANNLPHSAIWNASNERSFGLFRFGIKNDQTNAFGTNPNNSIFKEFDANDSDKGITETRSSDKIHSAWVTRFYGNQINATDFRVNFRVVDANGTGLVNTGYVDFTLNTNVLYT